MKKVLIALAFVVVAAAGAVTIAMSNAQPAVACDFNTGLGCD